MTFWERSGSPWSEYFPGNNSELIVMDEHSQDSKKEHPDLPPHGPKQAGGEETQLLPVSAPKGRSPSLFDYVKSKASKMPGAHPAQKQFFRFLRRLCAHRDLMEQLARLRDAILLSCFQQGNSGTGLTIALTGPKGGEGTSLAAVLLGLSLGECSQRRVAFLDGKFNIAKFEALCAILGLSEDSISLKKGFAQVEGYYNDAHANVCFLRNCSNESTMDFFSDKRIGEFLVALRRQFDLTILDLPAMLKETAAVFVLPHVDQLYIVAEAGKTRLADIEQCRSIAEQCGREVSGIIINKQRAPWWTRFFWREFFF
jgi:Mrp family chromosome partitioning ATPase